MDLPYNLIPDLSLIHILSDMMASKKYMETIINSINEPIIGLNNDMEILFINDEALNVINPVSYTHLKKKLMQLKRML